MNMANCIPKAIALPITTRAIGFSCSDLFSEIFSLQIKPVPANIYQLYRVSLALINAKLARTRTYDYVGTEEYWTTLRVPHDFMEAIQWLKLPDLLAYVIDSIGRVKTSDRIYVPKIGRNNTTPEGLFIPQSEQINYDNLRKVVISLSNNDTPVEYRIQFYKNNPIPGAVWRGAPDNPILCNADEIIPDEYTVTNLLDDLNSVLSLSNVLQCKQNAQFFRQSNRHIRFDRDNLDGHKSMLVCNDQETLRVCDRRSEENLNDYCLRIRIEGSLDDYSSLENLTEKQQVIGCYTLLGERPNVKSLIYPVYTTRLSEICPFYLSCNYYRTLQLKLLTY